MIERINMLKKSGTTREKDVEHLKSVRRKDTFSFIIRALKNPVFSLPENLHKKEVPYNMKNWPHSDITYHYVC